MKIFTYLDDAIDYCCECDKPVQVGLLDSVNGTSGETVKIYPSRKYEHKGQFFGLRGHELWDEKIKKWVAQA